MTKTIYLSQKNGNATEDVQHKIEDINIFQFMKTLGVVKDILKIAQEDKSIKKVITSLMESSDVESYKEKLKAKKSLEKDGSTDDEVQSEEELAKIEAAEAEADAAFMQSALEAFEVLLTTLPEKTFELLSILSGIDSKLLQEQKVIKLFDIYDAIIEVNDVKEIIDRSKKSLNVTTQKMNFKMFTQKKAIQDAVQ